MTAPAVVLVEDDPALRTLTARALQENGYTVRPCATAPEMWRAMEGGPVDLVLLDGWKDLYLELLRALEPSLRPGALVIADDTTFESVAEYLHYVRDPEHGYVSVAFPVEDGMEISCRL